MMQKYKIFFLLKTHLLKIKVEYSIRIVNVKMVMFKSFGGRLPKENKVTYNQSLYRLASFKLILFQ